MFLFAGFGFAWANTHRDATAIACASTLFPCINVNRWAFCIGKRATIGNRRFKGRDQCNVEQKGAVMRSFCFWQGSVNGVTHKGINELAVCKEHKSGGAAVSKPVEEGRNIGTVFFLWGANRMGDA